MSFHLIFTPHFPDGGMEPREMKLLVSRVTQRVTGRPPGICATGTGSQQPWPVVQMT